jgi:hypothetical protein
MMDIEINNKQTLVIEDIGEGINVDVKDAKGRTVEPTLFISQSELVALLNLARELYANGITADEYIVYGNFFEDAEKTANKIKRLANY